MLWHFSAKGQVSPPPPQPRLEMYYQGVQCHFYPHNTPVRYVPLDGPTQGSPFIVQHYILVGSSGVVEQLPGSVGHA